MKLDITSNADISLPEMAGYSVLLSFDSRDGKEERISISSRLVNK
jgi:hypothetical protein